MFTELAVEPPQQHPLRIEADIVSSYVSATKEDLAFNNFLQRAKQPGFNPQTLKPN